MMTETEAREFQRLARVAFADLLARWVRPADQPSVLGRATETADVYGYSLGYAVTSAVAAYRRTH